MKTSAEESPIQVHDRLAMTVLFNKKAKIIPNFDTNVGFRYPEAEEAFGLSPKETIDKLEYLGRLGYFDRTLYSTMLKCPTCGEFKMFLILRCPKCNSTVLQKGLTLKHYECGGDGFEEEFLKDGAYVCPKCNKRLEKLGVDFGKIGTTYGCLNCREFFGEPLEKLNCFTCVKEYMKEECVLQPVWGYEINSSRLKDIMLDVELEVVKNSMGDRWDVELFSRIKGESGIEHMFTFKIRKVGPLLNEVVVDVEYSKQPVNQDPVMRFFAKKVDVWVSDSVLIVIPGLEDSARKLSERYKLNLIEAPSLREAIKPLREIVSGVLG